MSNNLGFVIFAGELKPAAKEAVRLAASKANFPEETVRELRPRNIFIRMTEELVKQNIIKANAKGTIRHKISDDEGMIEFQLTRFYVENHGAQYDPAATLTFNTATGGIYGGTLEVNDLACKLFHECAARYSITDIHAIVSRVLDRAHARSITIRDAVNFVGLQHETLVNQIKTFYETLGCSFCVLPVGTQSGERKTILRAVVQDVLKSIDGIGKDIQKLQKSETGLTPRMAKARLKELRESLKEYTDLATSLRIDVGVLLDKAGEAGQIVRLVGSSPLETLIADLRSGKLAATGVVADLVCAAEPEVMSSLAEKRAVVPVAATEENAAVAIVRDNRELVPVDLFEGIEIKGE